MSRAKRQKTESAAFAASQPLFEAVRSARDDALQSQAVNLTIAHDVVKNIHVGVQNNDEHNNIERHVAYMDAIVESWRSATDAYCNIFAQLTSITAEKPNEGIGAAESHGFFQEMLETAQKAQDAAKRFTLAKERAMPEANTTIGNNTAETVPAVESDDEIELKHKPVNGGQIEAQSSSKPTSTATPGKQLAKSDKVKLDKSGTRVLWEKGAEEPSVPFAMLGGDEKKEWLAEKTRQKREKQRGRAHEIRTKKGQQGRQQKQEQTSVPPSDYHSPQVPGVEYEDLSAEVDARIKAKEEAKKAKKQEKKRKRESKDSFADPDTFQEDDDEEDTIEVKQYEKPSKKKFKHSSDEAASNPSAPQTPAADSDTILVGKKEKRKSGTEEEVVVTSKKRKKNKG
ncbi:hypothetical protein HII31_05063 [Pseudocercospora fuligena]|uniref:Uncharacterized protein n=1 Tax=Pseudocercospora fuligena TaxID=685502 RepID=A0A8H6R4Z1_9PEZI|nr:hypothetical protein HII31_12677 [Pseudocercospora fuligena]KAF7193599.1 hypothetical protein HII31_05063 [Pseudocercospora fuligena]